MADENMQKEEKKPWEANINEAYELRRLEQEAAKEAAEKKAREEEKKQADSINVGRLLGLSKPEERHRSDAIMEKEAAGKKAAEKEAAGEKTAEKKAGKQGDSGKEASEEEEKKESRMIIWWLPGFRSHTIWKMVVATMIYAFLIFYVYTTAQYQIESGVPTWKAVLGPTISCIIAPIFAGNPGYFDYYIPVLNRVNIWFRRLLRVTLAAIIFVGGLML